MDRRVPEVRFKGFTDDWEQCELQNIVDIVMGQSPSSSNYTQNPKDHILVQGNADIKNYRVEPRVWTTQITKTVPKNTIILSVRAPVGDVGITDYDVVLGRGVAGIKGNYFIYQILIKMNISNFWKRFSTGSTFESINSNDIKNAEIFVPTKKEQRKLGTILKLIDNLVDLQQEQLILYNKLKHYFLQKLFPSYRSNNPQIFFPNFGNKWLNQKANTLFKPIAKKKHGDLPVLSVTQDNGIVKRSSINFDIKYNESSLSSYKLVCPGNFVISLRSFQGGFELSNLEGIVSPAYTVFSFKDPHNNDNYFWKEKFKTYIFIQSLKTITFGIRDGKSISFSEFETLNLKYPKDASEQRQIGLILSNLNRYSSKQQKTLKTWNKLKKNLLQKLFI